MSSAFNDGGEIPAKYTCDGEDVSPPFEFVDVPDTAGSLILMVIDPDATGGEWVHWLVWNIDPNEKEVPEGRIPKGGIQGQNSFTQSNGPVFNYGGPCPPTGTHRYQFKLIAIDKMLEQNVESSKEDIIVQIDGHSIAESTLTGIYSR